MEWQLHSIYVETYLWLNSIFPYYFVKYRKMHFHNNTLLYTSDMYFESDTTQQNLIVKLLS